MKKLFLIVLLLLSAQIGYCQEKKQPQVRIGMKYGEAKEILEKLNAKETEMDIIDETGKEKIYTYELGNESIWLISVNKANQIISGLEECDNTEEPKSKREWRSVECIPQVPISKAVEKSLPWSNKFPYPYKKEINSLDSIGVSESYSSQWVETSAEKWPGAVSKAKEALREWGQDSEKYKYKGKQYDYKISVFESSSFISVVFYPIGLEGLERHVEVRLRDCSEMPIDSKKRKYFEVVAILPGA